ncbi:hypothetical protein [Photobacterium sp. GSS17]|uniref:hypothetical protein n=1 Tax=Photobacterium sp. GSS17 TaxID=3020715 RepID=UPI0023600C38|nr:hypothetical protein [Photobacterium sp. GSS17]
MNITIDKDIRKADQRIAYATRRLKQANSSDIITIVVIFNNGGFTPAIERLVDAIDKTKAFQVHLVFSGYAVSSAAYLFAYYVFYNKKRTNITVHVKRSLSLVYHKPRTPVPSSNTGEVIFANTLPPPYPTGYQLLINTTTRFDNVFDSMMKHFRASNSQIAHNLEDVYNYNGDIQIMFDAGKYR